jgi:hypothetical protein
MVLLSCLFWGQIAVVSTSNEGGVTEEGRIINRLNYGAYAVQTGHVDIVDTFWTAVVHVQVPNVTRLQMFECHSDFFSESNSSRENCSNAVDKIYGLWNKINSLLLEHSAEIEIMIPEVHQRGNRILRQRITRGLFDIVGTASSFLFGVATKADLMGLRNELHEIRRTAAGMAGETSHVRDDLSNFVTLENQRLSNIDNALNYQQQQISKLSSVFTEVLLTGVSNLKRIELLEDTLSHFITMYDHMLTLSTGVEALVQGHLSPKLIPRSFLNRLWLNVSRQVRDRGLQMVLGNSQLMYSIPSFDFARQGSDIVIRLKIPLTSKPTVRVFNLYSLPLPIPGNPGLFSQIKHLPDTVLYDHDTRILGTTSVIPDHNLILNSQVTWHKEQHSCLLALLTDRVQDVKDLCYFELTRDKLTPEVRQLRSNFYVFTNFTNVGTYCKTRDPPTSTIVRCEPCFVHTTCDCLISATNPENNEVVTIESPPCASSLESSNAGTLHPINLIVLQSFYNNSRTVTGRALYRFRTRSIEPLKLKFLEERTKRVLATNQHLNYSIQRVAEHLSKNMNDTIVGSVSEAVLLDYFERTNNPNMFHINQWIDWSICILYVIVIILCIFNYRNRRMLTMMATPAVTQMIPLKARAYDILIPTVNTLSSATLSENNFSVKDYLTTDLYALLLYIFVFIILLYLLARCFILGYFLLDPMKSDIALIFETSDASLCIKWMTLPDSNRNYEVSVPHTIIPQLYNFRCFGLLKVDTSSWRIFNTLAGKILRIPKWTLVSPTKMRKLKYNILTKQYDISMAVVHSHHIEPIISRPVLRETEHTSTV